MLVVACYSRARGRAHSRGSAPAEGKSEMFLRWFLLETDWGDKLLGWAERVCGLGVMVIDTDDPHGRRATWTFSAQLDDFISG